MLEQPIWIWKWIHPLEHAMTTNRAGPTSSPSVKQSWNATERMTDRTSSLTPELPTSSTMCVEMALQSSTHTSTQTEGSMKPRSQNPLSETLNSTSNSTHRMSKPCLETLKALPNAKSLEHAKLESYSTASSAQEWKHSATLFAWDKSETVQSHLPMSTMQSSSLAKT